jgi:glutamate-5-semialdehyde dehydrogenase
LDLNIKFIENLEQAIKHIRTYSTKHSDWILSDNLKNIEKFRNSTDSSIVYVNTSTRFSDWECFGFGWEIWISTQKLHARWPMWADVLVTYKYVVESEWKLRN